MRAFPGIPLVAGLAAAGCMPPPTLARPPIVLQTQTTTDATTAATPAATLGPAMLAAALISGPGSPWGAGFTKMADGAAWQALTKTLIPAAPLAATSTASGGVSSLTGLTRGGIGAAVPVANWDPRRAWATGAATPTLRESPPGWGDRTWGPSTLTQSGSTWGQAPQLGMFNLSRGAAEVSGWGMDSGFFSIPQAETRRQMDAYLQQINSSPTGQAGVGQTRLNQSQFPFLRPVQGPLVPPT
jgi:hypothetical protein